MPVQPKFLKLQWIFSREKAMKIDERAHWPVHGEDTQLACRGCPEYAPINCTSGLWWNKWRSSSPSCIPKIVWITHLATLPGGGGTRFTCHNAFFYANRNMDTIIRLDNLPHADYHAFGPGTRQRFPSLINKTERQVERSNLLTRCAWRVMN